MPARTIDDLGVEVSTRYAQDQEQLDKSLIREAPSIPGLTTIDVTQPSFSSEFYQLFEEGKQNTSWALFAAPLKYTEQTKRLFTYQLAPSLGALDKLEGQNQRILSAMEGKEQAPQEKREQQLVTNLLNCIRSLDQCIIDANARRTQYTKG